MASAQGGITIRRLRNGDSLFVTFDTNGVDLYQGIDPESGAISPDWNIPSNQPTLTPRVSSARGNFVSMTNHRWYIFGSEIEFTVNKGGNIYENVGGEISLNKTTGTIRFLTNIATVGYLGNFPLKWAGTISTANTVQDISKEATIRIGNMGSSSAVGMITAITEQISALVPTTTLKTSLRIGTGVVTDYYPKWWRDDTPWTVKNGDKNPIVTRDDVDGTQLFVCRFYKNSGDSTEIAVAGIRIIDVSDEYQVPLRITSANKEVDKDKPVTVQAYIYNNTTNTEITPSGQVWKLTAYINGGDFTPIKTSTTNTIQITTNETDRGGIEYDIDVIAEVNF